MKLNITLPCYNEEKILNNNVIQIFNFLNKKADEYDWQIVIADNNSTDNTAKIAKELTRKFEQVKYLFIQQQGKGIAIKSGWQKFEADIYIFMDADLATDLKSLPELINSIKKENYDITTGSRFHKQSIIKKPMLRKMISHILRIIKKIIVNSNISDLPCGFKAVNKKTVEKIIPKIKNNEWFFDLELLILAEHFKYKIKEIPIQWEEKRKKKNKSRVKIIPLGFKYIKNLLELKKRIKNA
ncbi:MAG: glycosyltransferase [Patescibacteria group bacterium]|nr:glycosyltransferase [Patescibacteria group bacterium]